MVKKNRRCAMRAARVQRVAELTGKSKSYVYMVVDGTRNNEDVLRNYMFLAEGENALLTQAKELVNF